MIKLKIGFKNVSLASIKSLSEKFDEAVEEGAAEAKKLDADVEELIDRNRHNQEVLVIYEREIPELRKQVADLGLLKSSLERKCYRNDKKRLNK
jgi:hypothetical protein